MEFSNETLDYFRKGFSANYKYFSSQMNKLQIVIDSADELEYFKVHYWMKAQEMSTQVGFNSILAISHYRINKVKQLDMPYEEFFILYNQDRLKALIKLFLEPIHKSYLKLLDEVLGYDSIEILFKLHKLQPSQSLFKLINQKGTLKERYERDLERYMKRGSLDDSEEACFFESNVFHPTNNILEEDIEFEEGEKRLKQHYVRERNPQVIKLAKEGFKAKNGRLFCEVCGFDFYTMYGEIGQDFIEGHHTIPISKLEDGQKTRIEDIALVCSNCHKMLHRRRPCLSKEELKELINR
ncbi:HNH endonuclease [Priestia megaterium]|uniref:HNH endonuclease n=1 Tax=Priestia megaterium TaxID=1404 RepID=UPI001E63CE25|nr:HNH endonuclease [Priestia megaterium]